MKSFDFAFFFEKLFEIRTIDPGFRIRSTEFKLEGVKQSEVEFTRTKFVSIARLLIELPSPLRGD